MAARHYSAARLLGITLVTALALAGGILIGHFAWDNGKQAKPSAAAVPAGKPKVIRRRAAAPVGGRERIHGGVVVTRNALRRMMRVVVAPGSYRPRAEDDCADASFDDPSCRAAHSAQAAALPVISVAQKRETSLNLPQTPVPTKSWKAAFSGKAGFPADAQIAVSSTHVIVSNRQQMRYYDKNGNPVGGPVSSSAFFAPLNLKDAAGNSINRFNDIRLVFDEYRKRFWMTTYAYTGTPNVPLDKQRYFLPLAVSKDENPLDGWYLYWWDGASQQGNAQSSIWQPGDAPDYPVIGIDPTAVTITHSVNAANGNFKYWRVTLTPAGPLSNGQAVGGWQYWSLKNPDNTISGLIDPAVHHGSPAGGWSYWLGRQGSDTAVVWRIKDPFGPNRTLQNTTVKLAAWSNPVNATEKGLNKLIKMTNLGTNFVKSVYRNGYLYGVTNDARDWDNAGVIRTSVRYVRLPVGGYPNIPVPPNGGSISRTFGGGNPGEEIGGNKYYAWPAVEVNSAGDAGMIYARTGDQVYPEVRLSAYMAAENDIRPSRQLKAGDQAHDNPNYPAAGSILAWGDTAGASADPSDNGLWFAQEYASSTADGNGNYDIWVGKLFGG